MEEKQVVTMTFFRYLKPANKWWAFRQMGLAPKQISGAEGLEFFRLLGSGSGNGFSILPDFGAYGLLAAWQHEAGSRQFFSGHTFFQQFRQSCDEILTIFMRTTQVHGRWEGQTPFRVAALSDAGLPLGVLTRATIRPGQLWRFWRSVPQVSRSVENQEGLLFSKGIGELPLVQQATFSLWQNSQLMKDYAYKSRYHKEVVRRTRELGWYKEEMFARFQPYAVEGSWEGRNPLDGYV